MIQNARKIYEGYNKSGVEEAILVRKTQLKLGNPSQKDFMKMAISKSSVKSIHVNPCSITNSLAIYGPGIPRMVVKQGMNQPPSI